MEILRDPKNCYTSTNIGYSKITEEGEKHLLEYISYMAPMMFKEESLELNELAKSLVIQELKK